jgi:hypothetical protein
LVGIDGTWNSSDIPILDPASTVKGSTITDKIVPMTRAPRDPLLRGWYGYYGEGVMAENDMEGSFGYDGTKFMNYKDTVKYYKDELGLDKDSAEERTVQQGKKPNLHKKVPKKIKNKKNFIDRLILKEKGLDESEEIDEDIILDKQPKDHKNNEVINSLLKRNLKQIKTMASQNGLSTQDIIRLLNDEQ